MAFIFHNIWDFILPIDELIFFKMVIAPPSRKKNDAFTTFENGKSPFPTGKSTINIHFQ